jgi:hypothetical protein
MLVGYPFPTPRACHEAWSQYQGVYAQYIENAVVFAGHLPACAGRRRRPRLPANGGGGHKADGGGGHLLGGGARQMASLLDEVIWAS